MAEARGRLGPPGEALDRRPHLGAYGALLEVGEEEVDLDLLQGHAIDPS
ncbi:MAG: hypothetical protein H6710_15140 [Myxococcales bacterium]|nr:hypothetical protein [Myxococcales bacterium]